MFTEKFTFSDYSVGIQNWRAQTIRIFANYNHRKDTESTWTIAGPFARKKLKKRTNMNTGLLY
jgi:hypothetical protein